MTPTTTRTPFMPLDVDLDDKLERLAQSKGVAALVKPAPATDTPPPVKDHAEPKQVRGGGAAPHSTPSHATTDAPETRAGGGPTPRSRMKSVNLELPDYVWTDLKIRAAREAVSVRHILMTALRAHGITIADADMIEDGRRLRT